MPLLAVNLCRCAPVSLLTICTFSNHEGCFLNLQQPIATWSVASFGKAQN
jgi:hypothetical protein